jgi:hypothetical protein
MPFDKSALGNRHTCYECEVKFYDMNRDPICPTCKADQREGENVSAGEAFLETLASSKRKTSKSVEAVVESKAATESDAEDDGDDDAEDLEDDDEDELLASLSGDDEEEADEL